MLRAVVALLLLATPALADRTTRTELAGSASFQHATVTEVPAAGGEHATVSVEGCDRRRRCWTREVDLGIVEEDSVHLRGVVDLAVAGELATAGPEVRAPRPVAKTARWPGLLVESRVRAEGVTTTRLVIVSLDPRTPASAHGVVFDEGVAGRRWKSVLAIAKGGLVVTERRDRYGDDTACVCIVQEVTTYRYKPAPYARFVASSTTRVDLDEPL